MSDAPFPGSRCHGCAHLRVVSASRSAFLRCDEGRPPKYPPQPVRACPFFTPLRAGPPHANPETT